MDCAALWCVVAHICAPLCVVAAVNDHQANTTLTELYLRSNGVGNAGATALADALQATVLTCEQSLSSACACCCHRCPFTKWCKELASSTCCAICLAASVFFFCLGVKCSVRCVVLKLMWHSCPESKMDWSELQAWHLLGGGAPPQRVIRTEAAPCEERP